MGGAEDVLHAIGDYACDRHIHGVFTGTSLADHKSSKVNLPALKIISPASGATIENPVIVIFETEADLSKMKIDYMMKDGKMNKVKAGPHLHVDLDKRSTMPTAKLLTKIGMNRYRYSLGSASHGKHTIRVYWADPRHHRAISNVQTVGITVK